MVPMNFLPDGSTAAYIDTGHWAHEAAEYAAYYGKCTIAATSASVQYSKLPQWPMTLPDNTAYLHITTNNTIYGTQWHNLPEVNTHLIADMSSDILSGKRDCTQYAMFYAAAQKNLGIAGVALAVIRKDLLEKTARQVPPMLSYQHQVKQNSVVNTANVAGVYAALLMLRWTKQKGLDNIAAENNLKAKALYAAIDKSKVFNARVTEATHRSLMNVCFTAESPEAEDAFMQLCARQSIVGIEGHRVTRGFRVSLYNAIPLSSVETLVGLMQEFESSL
jgi:phosphoserine aminotransferase